MTTSTVDVTDLPAMSTKKQVAKWAGVSDRHIDKMVRAGRFPAPIYIGERTPRWPRESLLSVQSGEFQPQTAAAE